MNFPPQNTPKSMSTEALPQTPMGELTALPRLHSWLNGATSTHEGMEWEGREWVGEEVEGKMGEGEGPPHWSLQRSLDTLAG